MTTCIVCGIQNRDQARFCRQCGAAMDGVLCSSCNAINDKTTTQCVRCSKRLAQLCGKCQGRNTLQARFCRHCGNALNQCPHCGETNRPAARFCKRCGKDPTSLAPQPIIIPGLLHSQYRIIRQLARGGMGIVYLTHDTRNNDHPVALKQLDLGHAKAEEHPYFINAFREEADLVCRLEHPNIVKGKEHFAENGNEYYVMEYIQGETLEAQTSGKIIPEADLLVSALQLCDALEYLHSQTPPIIYRDLKPANIMVVHQSGLLKLIDFGIVRRYKPGKREDTMRLGTPGYAAPEAISGQTGPVSDVFSLGATLHVLLTGFDCEQNPYNFPPARQLNGTISKRMEETLVRATQFQGTDRYQSIDEMRKALLRCKGAKKISDNLPSLAAARNSLPARSFMQANVAAPPPVVTAAQAAVPFVTGALAPVQRIVSSPSLPPVASVSPSQPKPVPPPTLTINPPILYLEVTPHGSQTREITVRTDNGVDVTINATHDASWSDGTLKISLSQVSGHEQKANVTVLMDNITLPAKHHDAPNLSARFWNWAEKQGASRQPWRNGREFLLTLLFGLPSLLLGAFAHLSLLLICLHANYLVPGSIVRCAQIEFTSGGSVHFLPVNFPVEVEVRPSWTRIQLGWVGASLAVTLEVLLLLWLALPLWL